ncbi:hypothetical protein LTR15_009249 [Elasticomyces elasticus]|nr:hypothetical protein LTR15_009249 [Elasticomyces elasticus]
MVRSMKEEVDPNQAKASGIPTGSSRFRDPRHEQGPHVNHHIHSSSMADYNPPPPAFSGEHALFEPNIHVGLTYAPLDAFAAISRVKSPKAGAVVLFAGCTRDSFANKPVTHLVYSCYAPLALKTLLSIAKTIHFSHGLTAISITHRLGHVGIGEESIIIALSSPHRKAGWEAGESCLELVKKRVEIWKEEWFEDGGVWRSNRDGEAGVEVVRGGGTEGGGGETS